MKIMAVLYSNRPRNRGKSLRIQDLAEPLAFIPYVPIELTYLSGISRVQRGANFASR